MRVVVIGNGIIGASAAYYLSGRGATVTVVDGGYQGASTQAGAGIVCPWVDHPEDDDWYRLTRAGARNYPDLVEELGEDIGYAKVGALLVSEDPADLEPVRALLRRRHPAAPEMGDITDVATPSDLFPPLSDTLSALLVPGAARVDGRSVRDALLRAAAAQGAEMRAGTATLTPDGEVRLHANQPTGPQSSTPEPPDTTASPRLQPPNNTPSHPQNTPRPQSTPHPQGTSHPEATPHPQGTLHPQDRPHPQGTSHPEATPLPEATPHPQGTLHPQDTPPPGGTSSRSRNSGGEPAAAGHPGAVSGEPGSWRQAAPLVPAAPTPSSTGLGRPAGEGVPLDADMVIVTAGAWTGEVCRPLGVELPVFPRRGQILHATLEGVDTAWWPIVLPHAGPYLLGFPGSRVVVGATVEDVGFAPRVTMGGLDEVIEAGLRVAPGLFGATVTEVRVGLRPVYAPGQALIGFLTPRVVVATGLSAYGLTAGPLAGRIAAALALGDEPPLDITPYAPPTP
ncbi:FAD-dependent oxidoreductase [Nonomuraea sp. NPDC002799]